MNQPLWKQTLTLRQATSGRPRVLSQIAQPTEIRDFYATGFENIYSVRAPDRLRESFVRSYTCLATRHKIWEFVSDDDISTFAPKGSPTQHRRLITHHGFERMDWSRQRGCREKCGWQILPPRGLWTRELTRPTIDHSMAFTGLIPSIAQGTQGFLLLHGDPRWTGHLLCHGLYHLG